ncbi:MAG TPA: hypothetical protein VMK12_11510 [Anaeromyxobacteraceae bacterium]|nr:hypothetical protein [Anaeromyxobacteraceae bacterium]
MSEPDQPLFEATRHPARWGWRIAIGSLLVVGFLFSAYLAIDSLGLEALLPVAALLVIGVQLGRWLGLGGRRVRPSRGTEEFIVFTAPYRQARPAGGATDDMSVQMPLGWNVERVVDFVLAAKERDAPYEEVVPALMASGFSEDEALVRSIERWAASSAHDSRGHGTSLPRRRTPSPGRATSVGCDSRRSSPRRSIRPAPELRQHSRAGPS